MFCFLISIYDYDERCENNVSLKLKRLILILVQLWTAQSDARHLGADVCCVVLSSVDIGYRNIKCDVNADVVHRCATLAFGTCSHSLSPFFFLHLSDFISLSEKDSQEKLVSGLQQEVDSQRAELEALQGSSLELQRTQDFLMQQREDLEMQLTRQQTEAQRGYTRSWKNDRYAHPVPCDCLQALFI